MGNYQLNRALEAFVRVNMDRASSGPAPTPFPNTKSTDFDGVDDYIHTSISMGSYQTAEKKTFSMWIKVDSTTTVPLFCGNATVIPAMPLFRNVYGFGIKSGTLRWVLDGFALTGAPTYGYCYAKSDPVDGSGSAPNIGDGNWHHVAIYNDVVSDALRADIANTKFWVDGVPVGVAYSQPGTFAIRGSSQLVLGGGSVGGYSGQVYLDGQIDEFAYWDRELTNGEVTEIYNSGLPINLNSFSGGVPDAWYRMGDSAVFNANSQWEFPEQTKINNWSSHSFEFDGVDQYIDLGDFTVNTDAAWSISLWANLDDFSYAYPELFTLKTDEATGFVCFMANAGSYRGINFGSNLNFTRFKTTGDISGDLVGAWVHIVLTYNGSGKTTEGNYTIYVDGASVANTTTGGFAAAANVSKIGVGAASAYFDGKMDGVSVWDEALTSGNVTSIFASGVPNDVSDLGISGLQGYWRMGEGADWNNTNWQVPDYSKNALFSQQSFEFDGVDQYVNIDGALTPLASTAVGSWSAWIKPVDAIPSSIGNVIMFGDDNANEFLYMRVLTDGKIEGQHRDAGTTQWKFSTDSSPLSSNTWAHVVIVQNATAPVLYINGVSEVISFSDSTNKTRWFSVLGGLDLGLIGAQEANNSGAVNFFDGMIDEVALFDTALTSGNVTSIYNSGVPNDISGLGISGLVAYYRMGENSTFNDDSKWEIPNYTKINNFSSHSFQFDGIDDDVTCTGANLVGGATKMSVSCWWYRDPLAGGVDSILGHYNASPFRIWFSGTSGFAFEVSEVGGWVSWEGGTFQSHSGIATGNWYHIACTWDASTNEIKGYINGVEGSASPLTTTISSLYNGASWRDLIMMGNLGYGGYGLGKLDDVAIFSNRVLSASDVTTIYNSGTPTDLTAELKLVGYWRMGTGATWSSPRWNIPDLSVNSNNGVGNGMGTDAKVNNAPGNIEQGLSSSMDQVDRKLLSPGNDSSGVSSGMDVIDNVNNAPDNENQGLSVGMVSGSVVEDVPT